MIKYYYVCPECGKEIEVNKKLLVRRNDANQEIFYENDYAYMILKFGDDFHKVLFDTEDVERVKNVKWTLQNSSRTAKPHIQVRGRENDTYRMWLMQRYILNMPFVTYRQVIDHINRNPLDNRKCNLRVVSQWENMQNKENEGKVKGVYFIKNRNKYMAEICLNRKRHKLGFYDNYEEALAARLAAEKIFHVTKDLYK